MDVILMIISIALFLSIMLIALLLSIRPSIMCITERFVCPTGTKMDVQINTSGDHRGEQRGLVVACRGKGQPKYVNGKAFLWLWLIFFAGSLTPAVLIGIVIKALIK